MTTVPHSHSSVSCFFRCPREYKHKYVDGFETVEPSDDIAFGKEFHGYLDTGKEPDIIDFHSARMAGLLRGYRNSFDISTDTHFEEPWEIGGYRGVFDGRGPGYIRETKSTRSSLTDFYWNNRVLDQQVSMYLWAANELGYGATELRYQVARRAPLKPRRNEDPLDYHGRYLDHLWKYREGVFVQRIMKRTPEYLKAFAKSLRLTDSLVTCATKQNLFPMNTGSCFQFGRFCEFLPVCLGEASITDTTLYKVRTQQ